MNQPPVWSVYKIPLIFGAASIILIGLAITLLVKSAQTANPIEFSSEANEATVAGAMVELVVDVAGAVVATGVYELGRGARVEEALVAAGGVAKNADTDWIAKNLNRAMKVNDGVKIYIPEVGETETSHNLGSIVATSETTSQNGSIISVNMASQSELESLSGVGPVTAQKIINNRPYTSLDQLVSKKAIGKSLYDKIKSQLSL